MDHALISVIAVGVLATSVVSLIVWRMYLTDRGVEQEVRDSLTYEIHRWCARSGWTPGDELVAVRAGPFDPRRRNGHQVIAAAHGDVAHRPAVLLLCKSDDEDGAPAYATVVLRVHDTLPSLEIRPRYVQAKWRRARSSTPGGPSAADDAFDRQFKIWPRSASGAERPLTGPARVALLELKEMGFFKVPFVDLENGHLRVLVSRWPPALDLDRYITAITDLTQALSSPGQPP
ncbi:hypothetical protein [Actinoplanes sp. NPDC049265]|uniref:hypothetical protein n=1 Tax=Actinoplanes sp. NPDC049265 TaxID=3363902 RepID=UPI003721DDAD